MTKEQKKEGAKVDANAMPYLLLVAGFVIGLIVAYAVFPPAAAPAGEGAEAPAGGEGAQQPAFTVNEAKISELGQAIADSYYLQTGTETAATFVGYEDNGYYATLNYEVDGEVMPIYVTYDYQYMLGSMMELDAVIEQINAAKAQAEMQQQAAEVGYPQTESPTVMLFVMSYCPYGNLAEDAMEPVVDALGDTFTVKPIYIIYDESINPGYNAENTDYCIADENETYCSMHGMPELDQGVRELVIYDLYGQGAWSDYVKAANAQCDLSTIETCWKAVAEAQNLSVEDIQAGFDERQFEILAEQKELTFTYQKFGSPSIVINGVDYSGQRTAETFRDAICDAYVEEPDGCTVDLSGATTATTTTAGSCG